MQSEQIDKLALALSKAQSVMQAAEKNKTNPHFKSTYADLASVIESVRKPLTDNGLSFTQTTISLPPNGALYLETTLLHVSGQWLRSEYPLLQGTPQQMGSSLTYARRYSLSSIAGIAADEDDNGNAATRKKIEPPETDAEPIAEQAPTGKPYKISFQSWRMFVAILEKELRAAESRADVFDWLELNKSNLDVMKEKFPAMFETLNAEIQAAIKAERP